MVQPLSDKYARKPPWLKRSLPTGPAYESVRGLLQTNRLHTVCQEAKCPNIWECFSQRTATFLIMGSRCTRNCRFCAVAHGPAGPPDPQEPDRVAQAVRCMNLKYVVITSVTRDDLPDGGAGLFAETIRKIRGKTPAVLVEVLIPDFKGDAAAIHMVVNARPDVLNHNLETVPRLYPSVRPEANYQRSLALLRQVRQASAARTKSGLMLGLGEFPEEIHATLQDLLDAGCRMLTLGQYLQPSPEHLPVKRFIPQEEFETWRNIALDVGFLQVAGGPFVRSSYHAAELHQAITA